MIKDTHVIIPAYDDANGVGLRNSISTYSIVSTASFAQTFLSHALSTWCGGTVSTPDRECTFAQPNLCSSEIDSILFQLEADETIHAEKSYKYDIPERRNASPGRWLGLQSRNGRIQTDYSPWIAGVRHAQPSSS